MVTMMTPRLAMMADTNGMKELIESAIQDINTKYLYNTTTINDNYVLASLQEDWGIYLALPNLCPCPPALVGLCLSNPINIYIKNQGLPLHLLPFLQY